MMTMILGPAYGRDYKKRDEAVKAFNDGKDFIIMNTMHADCGKYCSIRDFKPGTMINIRYAKMTKVAVIKIS